MDDKFPEHVIVTLPHGSTVRFAQHREILKGGHNKVSKQSKRILEELIRRPLKHVQFSVQECIDKGFFTREKVQSFGYDVGLPQPDPEPEFRDVIPMASPDYATMPLAELKELVKDNDNIKVKRGWRHSDYVEALEAAAQESSNEDSD